MKSASSKSPRRPRGASPTLWRVQGREGAIGYLVTDGVESFIPVAFVRGLGAKSLSLANAIRSCAGKAVKAMDLRGIPFNGLPDCIGGAIHYLARKSDPSDVCTFIFGAILFPVDLLGRIVGNDRTFGAGMIVMKRAGAREDAFFRFTRGNVPSRIDEKKSVASKSSESAAPASVGETRKATKRRK